MEILDVAPFASIADISLDAERTNRVPIFHDNGRHMRNVQRRREDVLGETGRRRVALRKFVVFHETLAERLDDSAFDLSLHAARVHRAANVMGSPDTEHLHFARQCINFDFGDLTAEHVGLPGRTAAIDRAETGVMSGEVRRSNWNDAALFDVLNGLRHRLAKIGLDRPDEAVAGLDLLGFDVPHVGDRRDETPLGFTAGHRHRIPDHIGLAGRACMRGFRRPRGVVIADNDILRPHADFLGRDLRQDCKNAFPDFRHAGDNLDGSTIIDFHPCSGSVDGGGPRNSVPTARHPASPFPRHLCGSFSVRKSHWDIGIDSMRDQRAWRPHTLTPEVRTGCTPNIRHTSFPARCGARGFKHVGHAGRIEWLLGVSLISLSHCVFQAQLERVHSKTFRADIEVRLCCELRLQRAERPKRTRRRIVGIDAVSVDLEIRDVIGPATKDRAFPDDALSRHTVGATVVNNPYLRRHNQAIAGQPHFIGGP